MSAFGKLILLSLWLAAVPAHAQEKTVMRWDHLPMGSHWTNAAVEALRAHGAVLNRTVPSDISSYCPAYPNQPTDKRTAFWVGLMSALAKHESTWRPEAVGGGGRWFGLLQISPGTARSYGCDAKTGRALRDGPANLSCAVRIWAQTVPRDGVISAGMRGIAADWGPFHSRAKRQDIMRWTSRQDYCQSSPRPLARPG